MSNLLKNMLEDHKNVEEVIPLESICSKVLRLVVDFCQKCEFRSEAFVKRPILQPQLQYVFPRQWEKEFFQALNIDDLYDLL
mmetsp:Transcript_18062/g.17239  ORF Transcript_18062/g.17239 Transcript_18062/m.17239 type:complete len:82 (-) Transcript_18062:66-311(-)